MSRTSRSADLRERMQRVATKPRKPDTAPAPRQRRGRPVAMRRVRSTTTPQSTSRPQSRARTLAAWASWELTSVPQRRWNWFMDIVRGRATS
ncbi:MAG TPA: hypothetical protein VNY76_02100 [Candidatus Acidoferrales bacterium]|jgi:hypothetical protein|nr:hypothetical protein [Candidatus Acidoferrales bacterium]